MSPETEGPPPLTLVASNLGVMNQQERPFPAPLPDPGRADSVRAGRASAAPWARLGIVQVSWIRTKPNPLDETSL